MKKITLLAVAALAMTFASCKKDYKCSCIYTSTGGGSTTTSTSSITFHTTKSKATTACSALNSSYVSGGYTDSQTCTVQ